MSKFIPKIIIFLNILLLLNSCGIYRPVDAQKFPPQPELRVKKNIEEGRGFRVMDRLRGDKAGKFEFANANPLWRASLDVIDFMPLLSVDYGGGMIITDWYGEENEKDSVKISIQFLSNEIRSDALKIKVFKKNCSSLTNCKIYTYQTKINEDLRVAILKKAAEYQKSDIENNKKEYKVKEGFTN